MVEVPFLFAKTPFSPTLPTNSPSLLLSTRFKYFSPHFCWIWDWEGMLRVERKGEVQGEGGGVGGRRGREGREKWDVHIFGGHYLIFCELMAVMIWVWVNNYFIILFIQCASSKHSNLFSRSPSPNKPPPTPIPINQIPTTLRTLPFWINF